MKVRDAERASDRLQPLDPEFYLNVGRSIQELEEAYDRVADRFSHEARLLENEIRSLRTNVESIFSKRLEKLVLQAALQAMSADLATVFLTDGMVEAERRVYGSMVSAIGEFRSGQLSPLLRPSIPAPKDLSADGVIEAERPDSTLNGGNHGPELMLVRVLRDIPEFLGVDERRWRLGREEVALLPRTNARVLVNQGAAVNLQAKR